MSIGVLITSQEHLDKINNLTIVLDHLSDDSQNFFERNPTLQDCNVNNQTLVELLEWVDSIKFILTELPNHSTEDSYIDSLIS